MRYIVCCIVFAKLFVVISCVRAEAQEFRWPREKAVEVAGGLSGNGYYVEGGYIRFFQPKKIKDLPFKKRFNSLIAQNKYVAFPCKRKPSHKIPPGVSTKVSVFYELGSGRGIQYRIMGMNASLHYRLFSNKYFYVSAKGGISISHNRLLKALMNDNNKPDHQDRFKYGVLEDLKLNA